MRIRLRAQALSVPLLLLPAPLFAGPRANPHTLATAPAKRAPYTLPSRPPPAPPLTCEKKAKGGPPGQPPHTPPPPLVARPPLPLTGAPPGEKADPWIWHRGP